MTIGKTAHGRRNCLTLMLGGAALSFASACVRAAVHALTPWDGNPTPPLVLKDVHGGAHDLSRYRGKVVLVNFWATWCEPCRDEMPSIQRLKERVNDRRFEVLAVNVDEPEARIHRFIAETRFDLPVLLDPGKNATRGWNVRVMPTTFIVGPDGRIRYRLVGDLDWSSDAVVQIVNRLLAGN